jgi:hypothetical protein
MFKMPSRKESSIEASVVLWARKNKILALKLQGQGVKGFPDRVFLLPGGMIFFVEFKKLGEKPTQLQEHTHALLRSLGFRVAVHDTRAAAIEDLQCLLDSKALPT